MLAKIYGVFFLNTKASEERKKEMVRCNRWPSWTCQCKMKDMLRLKCQERKS